MCDRYAPSGVCFTSAKGYDLEWCKVRPMGGCDGSPTLSSPFNKPRTTPLQSPDRGLPGPDVVIYLDLTVEQASQRGDYG